MLHAKGESPKERVDRELRELLEEIRVALPGLQLLFGFLLILPFTEQFAILTIGQRDIYITCFIATAASAALMMAPSARHRLGFRAHDKESLLVDSNRQVIVGLALVAFAMSLGIYLVVSVVVDATWAALLAALIGGWFALWWFVFPSWRQRTRKARAIA